MLQHNLIEKLSARDKDERYMAMHDLSLELDRDGIKMDAELERRVCALILQHLEDSSSDVKQQAVRCLSSLSKRVSQVQLEEIADRLSQHIANISEEEKRDIGSIGMKTFIGVLAPAAAPGVLRRVVPRLVQGISQDNQQVCHYSLEILTDILKRFGTLVTREISTIQHVLLAALGNARAATRKRASAALACLAVAVPDTLFSAMIEHLVSACSTQTSPELTRTYIQAISAVSRAVGHRLGKDLPRIVPLFSRHLTAEENQNDVELLDSCFQAFESFVGRCPADIGPFVSDITSLSLTYIRYDPNFVVDDENDAMEDSEPQSDDEEEEEDEEEYSDDDDISWKVRLTSAKCLAAVIRSRPELLPTIHSNVVPLLLRRFTERDETVKMEVFSAFKEFLLQAAKVAGQPGAMDTTSDGPSISVQLDSANITRAIRSQMRDRSARTRERCFELLRDVMMVLDGGLDSSLSDLSREIDKALSDRNSKSSLKIEALSCLRVLLQKHTSADHTECIARNGPHVLAAAGDSNYKIQTEALRVASEITGAIRKPDGSIPPQLVSVTNGLFETLLKRLASQDQDVEVKEAAISASGLLVSRLGSASPEGVARCLPVLLDRLRSETTRVITLRTLTTIAQSTSPVNLSAIVDGTMTECAAFIRKNDRQLKQATLAALNALIVRCPERITSAHIENVLKELGALISDSELHLSHLALRLCLSIVTAEPAHAAAVHRHVMPRTLALLQSPLLQGPALESLIELYTKLASLGAPECNFSVIIASLHRVVAETPSLPRQSVQSLAQCIGSLVVAASETDQTTTISQLMATLAGPNDQQHQTPRLVSLYSIGEVGRRIDVSRFAPERAIFDAFENGSEDQKTAGSYALGSITVGNLEKYVPFVLAQIESQERFGYLLLQALKEIISRLAMHESGMQLSLPFVDNIIDRTVRECDSKEEGVRNMAAECLGKLALLHPARVFPTLQGQLKSTSPVARATAVFAIKFAVSDRAPVEVLTPVLPEFLQSLRDEDLRVRRAGLLVLNNACHNKSQLVRPMLASPWLLEALYAESKYKEELVREINLGPFKEKVDDGLELRKLALACMDTLLERLPRHLDASVFLNHVKERLNDPADDIKQAAHQLLCKLAAREPAAILQSLDEVTGLLDATIAAKSKENATSQDSQRHEELRRSALRAVVCLSNIENATKCVSFQTMFERLRADAALASLFEAAAQDTEATAR